MTTTLVLGGVRSGKSRHAEHLMAGRQVTYVATSVPADPDDPEWAARVEAHRARRPTEWNTLETLDLAGVLRRAGGPVLIDCLGIWLSRLLDDIGWERPDASAQLAGPVEELVGAWTSVREDVVAVSNEVGWGVVPVARSGRLFRDELGRLNGRIADVSDVVHLVVAGRVLDLSSAPRVGE